MKLFEYARDNHVRLLSSSSRSAGLRPVPVTSSRGIGERVAFLLAAVLLRPKPKLTVFGICSSLSRCAATALPTDRLMTSEMIDENAR